MRCFASIRRLHVAGDSITGIIQQWKSISSSASSRISGSVSPPFGGFFEYDQKKERLEEVGRELEDPAIWSNQESAQELGREGARPAYVSTASASSTTRWIHTAPSSISRQVPAVPRPRIGRRCCCACTCDG